MTDDNVHFGRRGALPSRTTKVNFLLEMRDGVNLTVQVGKVL
jgi:hypothetical protein